MKGKINISGRMTNLRAILASNMKEYRSILSISQAQLAEKVNTSTNYIANIETKKKFPTPEMLERIAAALEIDPPALFATKKYPHQTTVAMAKFKKQLIKDVTESISETITVRFKKFNRETSDK